jgi:hypothetical protein
MNRQNLKFDAAWARNLVLLVKNTYIWLEQLSRKYRTRIASLDQIPEEEIAEIAARGITGLWLVGIWQRSPASRKIKQLYGRADALASAYSILQYTPADDLGGEAALEKLQCRLAAKGIALTCDMVPNHSGMDNSWMFEHPDRYIYTEVNPDRNFSFDTPNLSENPAGEIYLEKGYYDQSAAAEVFKLVLHQDHQTRYVYHGNDGTSMPWNDTAQLNYLNPETRRAVLEEIVRVAQQFPIIRLDAAMTLTRRHFKRLWFPAAGADQFIPTRDAFSLSDDEFDRLMPHEIWAEVIRELALKAPRTLLIAEAFWLTEHFFINRIGMHRVYNSSFMHHLLNENNREYRGYLKSILLKDPAMLERFVNFLTTPDELPAILQFGSSAKYFGAGRMLACLPGLPLFGHGQWEGYREQYGMDVSHPTLAEEPDPVIVRDHDRWIRPLLQMRNCFSSVERFRLYDFIQPDRTVNEDVYAFSNAGREGAFLVLFNNSTRSVGGSIHASVPQRLDPENPRARSSFLWENLGLSETSPAAFWEVSGEHDAHEEPRVMDIARGLQLELGPYESKVYRFLPV